MTLIPQVGMAELLMLGILALIVVGPKDLPRLMNRVGKAVAQLRRMADDFRASFDQMAREAEIDEMRQEIEALKAANPAREMEGAVTDLTKPVQSSSPPATELESGEGAPDAPSKAEAP
ncbi:MAG: Sec-independent protein translocase protein TatB [Pseudomonadota bacterium]